MTAPAEPLKLKDLDGALASLQQLKPPGASKGKIQAITQLCSSNIRVSEGVDGTHIHSTYSPIIILPTATMVVYPVVLRRFRSAPDLQLHEQYDMLTPCPTGRSKHRPESIPSVQRLSTHPQTRHPLRDRLGCPPMGDQSGQHRRPREYWRRHCRQLRWSW